MDITIIPDDDTHAAQLAHDLLVAAGPDRVDEVRVRSDVAGGLGFVVPAELAEAVGRAATTTPSQPATSGPPPPVSEGASPHHGPTAATSEPTTPRLHHEADDAPPVGPPVSTMRSRRTRQRAE